MEPVGHILARMMYLSMETKTLEERERNTQMALLKHCDELMLTELLPIWKQGGSQCRWDWLNTTKGRDQKQ